MSEPLPAEQHKPLRATNSTTEATVLGTMGCEIRDVENLYDDKEYPYKEGIPGRVTYGTAQESSVFPGVTANAIALALNSKDGAEDDPIRLFDEAVACLPADDRKTITKYLPFMLAKWCQKALQNRPNVAARWKAAPPMKFIAHPERKGWTKIHVKSKQLARKWGEIK